MSQRESIMVGLLVGIACPLLTFVGFWWPAAWLHRHVSGFPLQMVMALALTGLSVGLLLDLFFLRNWVQRFYQAPLWLMSMGYLGLCIVAVAFFMGFPVGTLILGLIAGVYMGRRERCAHREGPQFMPTLRRTALMAAAVTTMAALPIGVLALQEQNLLAMLRSWSGLEAVSLQGGVGFTLIGILCVLLFLVQYGVSKKAGLLAYKMGPRNDDQHTMGADPTTPP